jgi:hypothetical protein
MAGRNRNRTEIVTLAGAVIDRVIADSVRQGFVDDCKRQKVPVEVSTLRSQNWLMPHGELASTGIIAGGRSEAATGLPLRIGAHRALRPYRREGR